MVGTVIKKSKLKLLGVLLTTLIATFAVVFLFLESNVSNKTIIAIGIGFFALGVIIFSSKLINPKPILVINEKGFTDLVNGSTRWKYVKKIWLRTKWRNRTNKGISTPYTEEFLFVEIFNNISSDNFAYDTRTIEINIDDAKEKPEEILETMKEYLNNDRINNQTSTLNN
jgi:hypothetical protein